MLRDTFLEIDFDQLHHNLDRIEEELNHTPIMAVLKGNAYGHGASAMAGALEERGITSFAVATLNEALSLRKSTQSRILIFGPTPKRLYAYLFQGDLVQSIGSYEEGAALLEISKEFNLPARVEIKVDTGMHRWGFVANEKSRVEILKLAVKGLQIEGIYSHLTLTNLMEDELQYELFLEFADQLQQAGLAPPRHLADSIAAIDRPAYRLDQVRLGSALYGMRSFKKELDVLPIASLKTRIARLVSLTPGEGVGYDYLWRAKDPSMLATLPLGYVDGFSRGLSDNGYVLIKGLRAPVRGLICMDSVSVDVSHIEGVEQGEEVLVFGPGTEGEMTVEDMAQRLNTNKNQLLASLSARLPRRYIRKDKNWIMDDLVGK